MCFCLVLDGSVLSICYPLFVGRGYYYLCTLLSAICLFYIRAEDVVCYCLHCVSAICFTLHSSPPPLFVLSGHGSSFSWLFYFVPRCLLSDIHRRPFFSRRLFSFSFFRTTPPHILFGILLPAGSPKMAVERLGAAAASAVRSPELRERLSGDGAEIVGSTPNEFAQFIQSESDRYARILKESRISLTQ